MNITRGTGSALAGGSRFFLFPCGQSASDDLPYFILNDYSKKGGFATEDAAATSYWQCEEEFNKVFRRYQIANQVNSDILFRDYLVYWFEEVFSSRVESTTRMVGAYAIYNLILPQIENDVKLRYVNVDYLNALLSRVARITASAGNKGREILNLAMKDAVIAGYI